MKRTILLATLFATALLSGCKKDKDPDELIQGKWNVTHLFADGEDIIVGDADYSSKVVLEFTGSGSVIFNITEVDKTVTPADEYTFSVSGTYSIDGDNLTITANDGGDILTATGPIDIDSKHFSFTSTNPEGAEFIQSMEADKQ